MEILGDIINELLTLQLHLERLGRVRHNEGIRRGRLLQISGSNFRPFNVERIRRSSGSQTYRSWAEWMRPCMKRRRSPRTNRYLLRYWRWHRAGYATQPLFWFWQTSCRGKRLHLLDGKTRERRLELTSEFTLWYNVCNQKADVCIHISEEWNENYEEDKNKWIK